jgi:colicin import membrane protein
MNGLEREMNELVEIKKENAMSVFTDEAKIKAILKSVETQAKSLVPDVTTVKGRQEIASVAHAVARSKTTIDNAGKDLVAELKELPKQIDANRKLVRDFLDGLRDQIRKPLNDYEAEQERLKQEEVDRMMAEKAEAEAELMRQRVENDHELALFMNAEFDRNLEVNKKLKAEAEAKIKAEAEAKRIADIENAKKDAIKAEQDRIAREKAIEEAKEAKRLSDIEYIKGVNNKILDKFVELGLEVKDAKVIITAIAKGEVYKTSINY